jgi:hypothetical protein
MSTAGQRRASRLPGARNAWLALGAAILAVAQLSSLAAAIVRLVDTLEDSSELRLEIAYALRVAVPVIAAAGWLLASRVLRAARIDWRRMALPVALVAIAAAATLFASGLELLVIRDSRSPAGYPLIFWLAAAGDLLAFGAAAFAWVAFRRHDGELRRRWLAVAAVTLTGGAACDAADVVAQKSFYWTYLGISGKLGVGLLIAAVALAFFAIGAALAASALLVASVSREAFLVAAAGIAAVGFGLGAVGEALVASAVMGYHHLGPAGPADWIEVGYQVAIALALACVAAGARSAARAHDGGAPSSSPASGVRS